VWQVDKITAWAPMNGLRQWAAQWVGKSWGEKAKKGLLGSRELGKPAR